MRPVAALIALLALVAGLAGVGPCRAEVNGCCGRETLAPPCCADDDGCGGAGERSREADPCPKQACCLRSTPATAVDTMASLQPLTPVERIAGRDERVAAEVHAREILHVPRT